MAGRQRLQVRTQVVVPQMGVVLVAHRQAAVAHDPPPMRRVHLRLRHVGLEGVAEGHRCEAGDLRFGTEPGDGVSEVVRVEEPPRVFGNIQPSGLRVPVARSSVRCQLSCSVSAVVSPSDNGSVA